MTTPNNMTTEVKDTTEINMERARQERAAYRRRQALYTGLDRTMLRTIRQETPYVPEEDGMLSDMEDIDKQIAKLTEMKGKMVKKLVAIRLAAYVAATKEGR